MAESCLDHDLYICCTSFKASLLITSHLVILPNAKMAERTGNRRWTGGLAGVTPSWANNKGVEKNA